MNPENPPNSELIIYETEDGRTRVQCRFEDETLWLTQAQLVDLYQLAKSSISEHISAIFEEGELAAEATVRKFRTVGPCACYRVVATCKGYLQVADVETIPTNSVLMQNLATYDLGVSGS